MKVIFFMQIKHQTILQGDTINLGGHGQAIPAQICKNSAISQERSEG